MTIQFIQIKQLKFLKKLAAYELKNTEAVQKAIYALKHEWKECLTKIRIRKAINDFR